MESSPSSTASCDIKKRKKEAPLEHEGIKRMKTEEEGDGDLQRRPSGSARLSVHLDCLQRPITLAELMELLHFAALGKGGGLKQPSWCRVHHQRKVSGVNVVIVEGLTQSLFYKNYLSVEHLKTSYTTRITFTPSSNNVASEIFSLEVPNLDFLSVSKPEETLHKALKHHPVITMFGTQRRGLTAYVLSQQQMIKNHYPVKGFPGFEEFLSTGSDVCVTDDSPLYGLDCEMCLTEKGYELARASLVDSDGNCVLDELVKPQNRVFNYLTKFSGITAAMLRPITTTLRDVQAKIRMLLPDNAVLVGHSLNNDLIALKLIHQHVIDTSLLYRREFGQKFKLKVLAEALLKRQIQTEEKRGHNPTEDAVAALELAQYFIKTGPLQVVELHLEELWGYTVEEESPKRTPAPSPSYRFADVLQTLGRSVAYFGKRADVALDLSHQCWYSSDKEILTSFRKQMKHPFLSVLQLSSFSDHLKGSCAHQQQLYHNVCANLLDMCAVFAGPFPAGFSKRDVRRLFCCCGPVRKVQMLNTSVRMHAKVEFWMLEGAMLALKVLNGLSVLGQTIKVQRPVNESTLDLDLNLDALMRDELNTNRLYVVKLRHDAAQGLNISTRVNGCLSDAKCSGFPPGRQMNGLLQTAKINGKQLHPCTTKSELCEESVRKTFSRFGSIKSLVLPGKHGKHARHACIEFESPEGKCAALNSSEHLLEDSYLVWPSVTPPHLLTWVGMTTKRKTEMEEGETAEEQRPDSLDDGSQDQETGLLKKLDHRLNKIFNSLPDGTLSVVLLLGLTSTTCDHPGLCFLEIKNGS
ncbi:RNA exonuclease 5-like isoform X2 [Girardinichthys multiradiatus]|uniref:RNA exonuclease 5-like isoform X2 n=1 Tax=Girardinichthys multiradiatus TaxID=208333 RepID=UPI001FADC03A|nr:RNA exonuclease 5-like isoform X2 [Girardinichthys multiradiatus]XP_047221099.1 RNA exonuclease 5-like isoform X2 [Girardinichthys multiradiatus]